MIPRVLVVFQVMLSIRSDVHAPLMLMSWPDELDPRNRMLLMRKAPDPGPLIEKIDPAFEVITVDDPAPWTVIPVVSVMPDVHVQDPDGTDTVSPAEAAETAAACHNDVHLRYLPWPEASGAQSDSSNTKSFRQEKTELKLSRFLSAGT